MALEHLGRPNHRSRISRDPDVRELREETRLLIAMTQVTLGELENHEYQLRGYLTDVSGKPQENP